MRRALGHVDRGHTERHTKLHDQAMGDVFPMRDVADFGRRKANAVAADLEDQAILRKLAGSS